MSLNNCSFFSVKCVLIHTKVIKFSHKTLFLKDFLVFTRLFFLKRVEMILLKWKMTHKNVEMTFKSIGWHQEWHQKKNELSVIEADLWNDSMVVNKRLLSKRKIRWYTIAMKVLLFSSFEEQKEYTLALFRNSY